MSQRFPNTERLKSKKLIEKIFAERKNVANYPVKLFYTKSTLENVPVVQAGFSVPKHNFKNAVDRNRIKRLMKEAYRLKKTILFNNLSTSYAFMFLYLGKEKPDFEKMNSTIERLFINFLKKKADDENS